MFAAVGVFGKRTTPNEPRKGLVASRQPLFLMHFIPIFYTLFMVLMI